MSTSKRPRVKFVSPPRENGGIGRYNRQLMDLIEGENDGSARLCSVEEGQSFLAYIKNAAKATTGDVTQIQFEYGLFRPKLLYAWVFLSALFLFSRLRKTPVIVTVHEVWTIETVGRVQYTYVWLVHGFLALVASRLVFMSPNAEDDFRPQPFAHTDKIPHGVDLTKTRDVDQRKARETFDLDLDSTVVAQIGYVSPRKGTDAFLELASSHPEYQFLLAGGPLREEDKPYFEQVTDNPPENVQVTGVLSDKEFHDVFVATDAAVLAYRDIRQSGILNWCFAYGTPAVCSAIEHFAHLREDGAELVLFDETEESYPTIDKALETALDNSETFERKMQAYGRDNSLTSTAERYVDLYQLLVEEKPRSRFDHLPWSSSRE